MCPRKFRIVLASQCAAFAVLVSGVASAEQRTFDVPADRAVVTIPEFARQAGLQIVVPAEHLGNVVTPPLKGEMDVRAALGKLLAGTELEVATDRNGVVALRNRVERKRERGTEAAPVGLEEVVVTATRRRTALQDTPISVSALSGSELASMGADGFAGFYRSVPGLAFNQTDPGQGSFTIRGVNTSVFNASDNQAPVAVYLDELPTDDARGARALTDLSLFDVQRVEVLRGPQGTLFGSGALGGAIRVITNKPGLTDFAGRVEVDGASVTDGQSGGAVKAMANVPIVDGKFAVRAVGYLRKDGGWVDNLATGKKDVNGNQERGGRFLAKLAASDRLNLTATVVYQETWHGESGALDTQIDGRWVRANRLENSLKARTATYNFVADYDFGWATLMSSTTYARKDTRLVQGFENRFQGLLPIVAKGPDRGRSFAQEVRLASSGEGRLNWVVGAFYFSRERRAQSDISVPGLSDLLGTPDDVLQSARIKLNDTEKALYGEVSYKILPKLEATVGLRWFEAQSEYRDTQAGLVAGAPVNGPFKATFREPTPKFVLAYKPDADVMTYVSAAKGYRIGGTNIPQPDSAVPTSYQPDSLWNYEIGAKTAWFDHRLVVNAALYYIDWQKIQIDRTSLVTNSGYLDNGGSAHSTGLELEIVARPLKGLQLSSSIAWNASRSDETVPNTRIVKGDWLPGARALTLSTSVEYTQPLFDDLNGFVRADYQHVGKAYADFSNSTAPVMPAYNLVNLRLGVDRGGWTVSLYANNLLNSDKITTLNDVGTLAFRLRPRTIGLNVAANF